MSDFETPPVKDEENPISAQLLLALHQGAQRLLASKSPLLRNWGEHLLEDWRSLELIAERYRR